MIQSKARELQHFKVKLCSRLPFHNFMDPIVYNVLHNKVNQKG